MCRRNKEGSYATQNNRHRILQMTATQLKTMGYRNMTPHSLKSKHVSALVDRWKDENMTPGTIKNRMAVLRWWAEKVGKPNVINRNNRDYGIEKRTYVTNISKAKSVSDDLNKITNELVVYSLRLQEQFGLRREESIKFNVQYADKGDYLKLKSSWTKGGKERVIPIKTIEQRNLLNSIKNNVGNKALIPDEKSYKQQLKVYEWHVAKAGMNKLHGLRHHYAQQRYEELTGWKAPANNGPTRNDLSENEKKIDNEARLIISRELGHEREQITAVYLGR